MSAPSALPAGGPQPVGATLPIDALVAEAQRVLAICNACRYCEGYCAVFPALERRLEFDEQDVHYLANLCHNCGSCLYACQYAPPHEFQLNFPRLLAQVRKQTYRRYAWPEALGAAFERNGTVTALVTALALAAVFLFTAWYAGPERFFAAHSDAQGSFYAVLPHSVMAGTFTAVAAFVLHALAMSFARFWPGTGEDVAAYASPVPLKGAIADAAALKYLDGGGEGCTYPDTQPSFVRRTFHHFTFYGFLLCFAATTVATIYHYVFGWKAPYPMYSLPVLLGVAGGIGLLVGPAGLAWVKLRRDPDLADTSQDGMDSGFLVLLFGTSVTGLALLFLRLPYGKFMHALYRFAALVRYHIERKRPLPTLGSE